MLPCSRFFHTVCALLLGASVLLAEPAPPAGDAGNLLKAGKEAIKKGRFEEAVSLLSQAIASAPNNSEAYVRRAEALSVLQRGEEALKDMAEALRLEPEKREYMLERAHVYDNLNRVAEAIQDCTGLLAAKKDAAALLLRGQLYAKSNRYSEAIADYTEILKSQPHRSDLYIARGQLYRLNGQPKEAGIDFGLAIKANPSYTAQVHKLAAQPPTRSTIAKPTLAQVTPAAVGAGMPLTASAAAPKVLTPVAPAGTRLVVKKSEPKPVQPAVAAATPAPQASAPVNTPEPEAPRPDPAALKAAAEAQQVTAALAAGRTQLDAKQWLEAIQSYTVAIELRPKHAEAWLRRCMANHFAGNNKAAIEDCTKSLDLHTQADAFYFRGRALQAEKELHRASLDYGNAILVKPFNPEAHFHKAEIAQALDDLSAAIYGYSEAARQKQGYTEAIMARADLRLSLGDKVGYQQDLELAKASPRK